LNAYRRAAFFPDTFHEVNGVAHTSRQLELFARRRQIPFLSVRPGPSPGLVHDGAVAILELERSRLSFGLDSHLDYDPLLLRHAGRVLQEARRLGIELVHITGPGDMGLMGCYVAWRLNLPIVMGWHTNLHEYSGKRLAHLLRFGPASLRNPVSHAAERASLKFLGYFYGCARAVLAPNQELVDSVRQLSGRPTYLMRRGVDTELFTPAKRDRRGSTFRIGYVGRLTPEKNVRFLSALGRALQPVVQRDFEFYIVGQGSERTWLQTNVPNAILPGVLQGEELARAYANMDLFVFPSTTDTFGNVILEALASGLPCVVTASGGPKYLVQPAVTGYVAPDKQSFIRYAASLVNDLDANWRMKEAARHYACRLSWDAVFENVFGVYERCLTAPRTPEKARTEDKICLSV
jgi:phosphatidylinositol alpha 1,6-mannosyltransferase